MLTSRPPQGLFEREFSHLFSDGRLMVRRVMKFVHHLIISDVSTGLLACEVVIGLEYVVEVSPEIL